MKGSISSYRAQNKKSCSPLKTASPCHSAVSSASALYFCHYRNAMYMGGVKNFKKDGKGLLIHDNGLTVLCSHHNDLLHNHNIFYSQHCLLSAQYNKGKLVEAVYRTDGFLAHLLFNPDEQLEGKCKLLNYTRKTITYATFRKGLLLEKEDQTDFALINRIFDLSEFQFLIGRTHQQAIKHQIEKDQYIQSQKYGNKMAIGFEKAGLLNGLGFTIIFKGSHGGYNPDSLRHEDDFELKILQRGYMQNSQLHGFGEKMFKNGNLYIGQFKNGIFDGNGLLRNTAKKNWVSGFFEKGNLVDLFQYNNEGGDKQYDKIVQALHQRKSNWINNQVTLPSMSFFEKMIEKILCDEPSGAIKSLEQRKQEVLKKIQQNFLCDSSNVPNFLQSVNSDTRGMQKNRKSDTIKHFVHSFIPEPTDKLTKTNENKLSSTTKFTPTKRSNLDIRKSKIFNKTATPDKYLRLTDISSSRNRMSRTPEQKKKIFNQTASTALKTNQKADVNSPQNEINRFEDSKLREDNVEGASGLGVSEDEMSNSSKDHTKAKNSARKNKIFNFLQDKSEELSPRFIYNRMDQISEEEKRKRIGMDEHA